MSRTIFWVLIGTVLLSPVPFGSIFPWSYALMAMVVAALILLWSVRLAFIGDALPVTPGMIRTPMILFFAVIVWAFIQAAPWTPAAWHNPVWAETSAVLGTDVQGYISVAPYATGTSIMRLLTYAGIFWLALQFGRSGNRARQVFYAVAIAGLIYGAYGLFVEFTGSQTILWYDKERYLDNLTSTFRYKNAYASYAGMGLICTIALLVRVLGSEDYTRMGPRERLHSVLILIFERSWYIVLAFVVIASALLLSDSRGGFLAAIIGMITFAAAIRFGKSRPLPYGRTLAGATALAGCLFIAISGGTTLDRLGDTESSAEVRKQIYSHTIEAIREHPIKGWGLNSFASVFAKFQGPELTSRAARAHNEYLDNALGLGIPAAAALVLAIGFIGVRCLRGSQTRQRDAHYPATGFALTVFVCVQSLFDFVLQVPGIAATFALLLGICCAQSWSSQAGSSQVGSSQSGNSQSGNSRARRNARSDA